MGVAFKASREARKSANLSVSTFWETSLESGFRPTGIPPLLVIQPRFALYAVTSMRGVHRGHQASGIATGQRL